MSLTVCITTPEGIVLAADSRQTYRNVVGAMRIGSDSATKIFPVNERIGVTVAGPAFLKDPNDSKASARSIGSFISDFLKQKVSKEETVKSISEKLRGYLEEIYNPKSQLKDLEQALEKQIIKNGGKIVKRETGQYGEGVIMDYLDSDGKPEKAAGEIMPIALIVAGYDVIKINNPEINAYVVHIPGPTRHVRKYADVNQFGASWTGQGDVLTRVILGRDPRVMGLSFVQSVIKSYGEEKINKELGSLEYIINWGAMTLGDAIDFAKLMIETTSAIQRFSDGIKLMPGDMPGVGGPVDVAVILPKEGFYWHKRKELGLEKLDLDRV
jgi:hypothetical protein